MPYPRRSFIGDSTAPADKLANQALLTAEDIAKTAGAKQGAEDQALAGTTPVDENSGIFGMPTR
jgi:hypothetical protein